MAALLIRIRLFLSSYATLLLLLAIRFESRPLAIVLAASAAIAALSLY